VEKSFVRHGWTLIGHAGGDLLYVEKKSIRRFPNESKKYQLLRRHRGERGEARPQCRSGIFYFFYDLSTVPEIRALARRCVGRVPQVPQFAGFLRSPQKGFPRNRKTATPVRWHGSGASLQRLAGSITAVSWQPGPPRAVHFFCDRRLKAGAKPAAVDRMLAWFASFLPFLAPARMVPARGCVSGRPSNR